MAAGHRAGNRTAAVRSFPDRGADGDGLTQRQRRVLEVIRDSIERRGYPPSVREIGEAVGLSSASSVAQSPADTSHVTTVIPRLLACRDMNGVCVPCGGLKNAGQTPSVR